MACGTGCAAPAPRDGDVHVQQYGMEIGPALAAAFTHGFGFQASGASSVLPRQLIIARITSGTPLTVTAHAALLAACASAWVSQVIGRAYLVLSWDDWERIPHALDALRRAHCEVQLANALRTTLPAFSDARAAEASVPFSLALAELCALKQAWREHGTTGSMEQTPCCACATASEDAGAARPASCWRALALLLSRTSRTAWAVPENWSTALGQEAARLLAVHLPACSWWGAQCDAVCVAHRILHRGPPGAWAAYELCRMAHADVMEVKVHDVDADE